MTTNPMALETVCFPCYEGEHEACRHQPDGPRFGKPPPGAKCQCEVASHTLGAGTCSAYVSTDWSGHRCGKATKGTVTVRAKFGSRGRNTVEVERCGLHLAAIRRAEAREQERIAISRAREATRDRERENERAALQYVEQLTAEGLTVTVGYDLTGRCHGAVAIQGETLMGLVTELRTLRRDLGIPEEEPLLPGVG